MMPLSIMIKDLNNLRRKSSTRNLKTGDFEDLEVRDTTRKEKASRKKSWPVRAEDISNNLIQDKSKRMVVVGANVEALYPSLEAIEVATSSSGPSKRAR